MSSVDYLQQQRLDGRVAVVTGGASGIGAATAEALAQLGAHVAVTDLDATGAAALAARLPEATGYRMDVTDEDEVRHVVEEIVRSAGRIDILVNNVGLGARVPTTETPTERWELALAVGPTGSFTCAREVGRYFVEARSGAVVNVASIMGLRGTPYYPNLAYNTAKGAIVNFTRSLAAEWAQYGIRVNAVAPTYVPTAFTEPLLADEQMREQLLARTPLGRFATAEEVAAAIAFLAGDAAAMITGHILPIDGGWIAA